MKLKVRNKVLKLIVNLYFLLLADQAIGEFTSQRTSDSFISVFFREKSIQSSPVTKGRVPKFLLSKLADWFINFYPVNGKIH